MNGFGSAASDWLIVVGAVHYAATALVGGILLFTAAPEREML